MSYLWLTRLLCAANTRSAPTSCACKDAEQLPWRIVETLTWTSFPISGLLSVGCDYTCDLYSAKVSAVTLQLSKRVAQFNSVALKKKILKLLIFERIIFCIILIKKIIIEKYYFDQ
jgi:hypothetical protein